MHRLLFPRGDKAFRHIGRNAYRPPSVAVENALFHRKKRPVDIGIETGKIGFQAGQRQNFKLGRNHLRYQRTGIFTVRNPIQGVFKRRKPASAIRAGRGEFPDEMPQVLTIFTCCSSYDWKVLKFPQKNLL